MKWTNVLLLFIGAVLWSCSSSPLKEQYQEIDLLITNGKVVDGTGKTAYEADVFILNGKVVHIGKENTKGLKIKRTIDAEGKVVTPGFIDLHSHGSPERTPAFENFLAMGVTTITLGQDGFSPYHENLKDWQDSLSAKGTGTNIAMFVGHGTLRELSGIGRKEIPSEEELERMKTLLANNLVHCFGMSTGLEYTPALYAQEAELLELAKVVGEKGGMIMSHMRNEDDPELLQSIEELCRQGEFAPVHVSHLKSVYGKGEERAKEIIAFMQEQRAKGVQLTADIYPYNASYTGIAIVFPEWAKTKEQFEVAKKERREELETFIRNKVISRNGPEATLLGTAPYKGKTLADLEKEMGKPFEQILIDEIGPEGASAAYFVMNDELQTRLLTDSLLSVCSDGSPTSHHPRGHGTFAKLIEEYVNKRQVLSLEEAVRKVTAYPAGILKLQDRGTLKVGHKADVLIFDPAAVHATAEYSDPKQLAEGFEYVVVNGKVAREKGVLSEELYGEMLKPLSSVAKEL
ncbi:N-acyl-D-amino-acid deacylase family protein [Algivirga pacifica]|uniref:Amidohydrolase family protein n=1 Tax=Algivirga pacifica TaxID=1162670 RepID=A0ABP9D1A1_9BACT